MIYKLGSLGANEKLVYALLIVFSFASVIALLKAFKNKLPADLGRDFAFNGKLSRGKARGAGLIFIICYIIASALFISISPEYIAYYALIFAGMLSGYLDDRAEKPWGEYKKGIIDLAISFLLALTFANFNAELLNINLFFISFAVNKWIFIAIATIFFWLMINATNCTDGIDGFCGSLSINSLIFIITIGAISGMNSTHTMSIVSMIFVIVAYLWYNAEPSTMLMGDAGSRAIGLFIGLSILKTGNMILALPICFMILLDGLIGIVKIILIRFLKINALKNIRTPLHDHFRKNKGWSNTQVIFRFNMIQALISVITIILIK
ncbi:MAG: phospho-N-acetylmuramoyl-pentapeptide-transferase [Ruminococcaceae bacterium]|nr:phospho-N-acetylmuramoyl-pentapeptide-transferase [Oscillospiraceae bacterium]